MTSRELIAAEANNTDRIALYREGLFWKAYERSAYALCTQVRAFKPTRKILKTLAGGDIVSVGFPTRAADRILAGLVRLDLSADAVANASVGTCAAPQASATRMLLVAPHPIVERDFLAWKSALPISLTIPRPSAAESSCDDPASGEPLPRETSRESLRPVFGQASSDGASSDGRAASAGSAASAVSAANASQPHWWTRLGRRLVRWATRSGSPRAVAATMGFAELGSTGSIGSIGSTGFAAVAADDSSLSCISDVSSPAAPVASAGSTIPAAPVAPAAPVLEVAASTTANPAVSAAMAEQCLDALRKFEVADKTPMECMLFIAELKKRFL